MIGPDLSGTPIPPGPATDHKVVFSQHLAGPLQPPRVHIDGQDGVASADIYVSIRISRGRIDQFSLGVYRLRGPYGRSRRTIELCASLTLFGGLSGIQNAVALPDLLAPPGVQRDNAPPAFAPFII